LVLHFGNTNNNLLNSYTLYYTYILLKSQGVYYLLIVNVPLAVNLAILSPPG